MEIDNIKDYYNIAKGADAVQRFFVLIRKLAYFPNDFTKKDATELLHILDNERKTLKTLAETFIKIGEHVELITDENWEILRDRVLSYL